MSVVDLALQYERAGISVLPIRADKTKAPAVGQWAHLQQRRATGTEIQALFRGECGIAAIGGKVSGNLEIIDFDYAGNFPAWQELVEEHLGIAFFKRLTIVQSPRPGFHVYYRCEQINGNQKLAMKVAEDPAYLGRKVQKTLIETKAEGGYVLMPGCPPTCHETGRTYDLLQGAIDTIPTVTTHEREVMLTCARSFNEIVREEHHESRQVSRRGETPGNDFAAQTTWQEILRPHGYKLYTKRGEVSLWTRPGKEHGISASTNYGGSDLFYPFSTNCYPFDSERGYSKFAVYAFLNCGGDFHLAAKELAVKGFGERREPRVNSVQQEPSPKPVEAKDTDIIEPVSLAPAMLELRKTGIQPGASPGWDSLRQFWTLRKGELTLCTGIPSHGKSGFMNAVMMNLARSSGWKWAVFSPENLPHQLHIADLMEQYVGRPFNDGFHRRISEQEHASALAFIQEHFRFIAPPEDEETLERIMRCAERLVETLKIDGLVIDPWNELNHSWVAERIPETEYVSRCLKRIKRSAQRNNIHVVLVAHPKQLQKDGKGKYPIPTPYDISGSANWRNKADNCICVWRDEEQPGQTTILVQKVRRRPVGKVGFTELKYDVITGRYSEFEVLRRHREPGEDDE